MRAFSFVYKPFAESDNGKSEKRQNSPIIGPLKRDFLIFRALGKTTSANAIAEVIKKSQSIHFTKMPLLKGM